MRTPCILKILVFDNTVQLHEVLVCNEVMFPFPGLLYVSILSKYEQDITEGSENASAIHFSVLK